MASILLAEDDTSLRTFLARALKKAGHDVAAVGDGAEALALVQGKAFDLLLSDIVMPGLDGIALSREAGRLHPAMRIMFITGFAAVALNERNGAPRGAHVLSKPFHLKDLVAEVEGLLARDLVPHSS
jgi:two-component system cell cycle response regulator CpdR